MICINILMGRSDPLNQSNQVVELKACFSIHENEHLAPEARWTVETGRFRQRNATRKGNPKSKHNTSQNPENSKIIEDRTNQTIVIPTHQQWTISMYQQSWYHPHENSHEPSPSSCMKHFVQSRRFSLERDCQVSLTITPFTPFTNYPIQSYLVLWHHRAVVKYPPNSSPKRIHNQRSCQHLDCCFVPIASMYGIFTYIYHKNQPNVGKYTIHGSYWGCPQSINFDHLQLFFNLSRGCGCPANFDHNFTK